MNKALSLATMGSRQNIVMNPKVTCEVFYFRKYILNKFGFVVINKITRFHHLIVYIRYDYYLSIYLRVYSLHHNVLPTLQSIPLMTNGPLYPITQDSSCHGQHTMPRNPWSFPWPVPRSWVCMNVCVCCSGGKRAQWFCSCSEWYFIIATTDDCRPICKTHTRRMQN